MALCKHGKLIHPDDSCALCKLAQLETEMLEVAKAFEPMKPIIDCREFRKLTNNHPCTVSAGFLRDMYAALAQPAISKLPEANDANH